MSRATARRLLRRPTPPLGVHRLEDRTAPAIFTVQTPQAISGLRNSGCAAAGDFNGDGKTDTVIANFGLDSPESGGLPGRNLSVLLGDGTGKFGSPAQLLVGTDQYISYVVAADMNGDGKLDLVCNSSTAKTTQGRLTVFHGDGAGGFAKVAQVDTNSKNAAWVGVGQLTSGDTNMDVVTTANGFGIPDVSVNGNGFTVFQGDGQGNFSNIGRGGDGVLGFEPLTGAIADFNADGKQDIAFGNIIVQAADTDAYPEGSVDLYLNNGAGGFTAGNSYPSGGPFPVNMTAADLNADGKPDLAVSNVGQVGSFGIGGGAFGEGTAIGVLIASSTPGSFAATTKLTAGLTTGTSSAAFAVQSADFNLDGAADLAAITYGDPFNTGIPARVAVYTGDGKGNFAGDSGSPYALTGQAGGQFLVVGDFDGNASPDLLTVGVTAKVHVLFNQSSAGALTTTALASSANPASYGTGVTFTATVTAASGTPSGTVTFFDGAAAISGAVPVDAGGKATFTSSTLAVATHPIKAVFSGDSGFGGSTSSVVNQQVTVAATSITMSATPATAPAGGAVTLSAVVTGTGVVPVGTVKFYEGVVLIGGQLTTATSGTTSKAEFVTTALSVGSHTLTAVFAGPPNFGGSTSTPVTVTITDPTPPPVTPTVALSAAPNPSGFGAAVTFTATVSVPTGTPGGFVRFFDGAAQLGADVPLTAAPFKAQLTTSALAVGNHTIVAKYLGSPGFNPADSGPVNQKVNPVATGIGLGSSGTPATLTLPVTFTATVTSTTGTQVGGVQFYDGAAAIGGLQAIGADNKATFTTTALGVGSHDITAKFVPADANYLESTSAVLTQAVNKGGVTVAVTSGGSAVVTQPVTLTATLSEVTTLGPDPTGQVTFKLNGTVLGTAAVAGGAASLTVSTLPVGGGSVTAEYAGDATFAAATSSGFTQPITRAGVTLALSGSATAVGQPATFTVTVAELPAISPQDPTGQIVFRSGGATLATVPLAGGTATFTSTTLPLGTTTVTAEYSGDASFLNATSAGVTVNLTPTPTTVSLATGGTPAVVTVPVTLTATVAADAGSPAGTVQFFSGGTAVSGLVPVANGKAVFSTAALPIGSSALTAQFVPADAAFAGSTSTALTQQVTKAASAVSVAVDGTIVAGQPSTLRASVARPSGVTADLTGTVTFKVNGTTVGSAPLVGGVATATTTLPVGDSTLTAEFGGDGNFAPGAGQATATVTGTTTQPPAATKPLLVGYREFGVGAGAGRPADARFFNPDGSGRFDAVGLFPGQTGGVRVTSADFNADGVADLVVGTGPGSITRVVVLDGKTRAELFSRQPFEDAFTGGVYLSTGDVTGDGVPDLAISPDEGGGPRVRVFSGKGFGQIDDFYGIEDPGFRGGARAAIADLNGDGVGELVVAAGFGGGPRVAVWDGKGLGTPARPKLYGDFFVFEEGLRNGAFVAAGDVDGDGVADLISGGGPGGGPRVRVASGRVLGSLAGIRSVDEAIVTRPDLALANFFAGNPDNRGGVRVVARDLDNDNKADLVVGAGTGAGSRVTGYRGSTLGAARPEELFGFDAFPGFGGGVYVG